MKGNALCDVVSTDLRYILLKSLTVRVHCAFTITSRPRQPHCWSELVLLKLTRIVVWSGLNQILKSCWLCMMYDECLRATMCSVRLCITWLDIVTEISCHRTTWKVTLICPDLQHCSGQVMCSCAPGHRSDQACWLWEGEVFPFYMHCIFTALRME